MIYQLCLLFVLFAVVVEALQVSTTKPFYLEGEAQGENSTEAYAQFILDNPNHSVYTKGFMRTDTYEGKCKKWVRAQALPIGICFKQGKSGGSAVILQIMMGPSNLLRVNNVYAGNDCDGGFETILLKVPIVKEINNFLHIVHHEANIDINSPSIDGLIIIRSFYCSEGCTGETAQYDLISTTEYSVYDDPIGGCGLFKCSANEEVMRLKLYGSYKGQIHPYCNPDADPTSADASSVITTIEQPFSCTEERAREGDKQVYFPLFQTISCVSPEETNIVAPIASTPVKIVSA